MANVLGFIQSAYKKIGKNLASKNGFTLIEVIVFTVVISVVAATTVPPIVEKRAQDKRDQIAVQQLKDIGEIAQDFYSEEVNNTPHNSFSPISDLTLCQYVVSKDNRYDGKIWGKGCGAGGSFKTGDYSALIPRYLKVQAAGAQSLAIYGKSITGTCFLLTKPKRQPVATNNDVPCPDNNNNVDPNPTTEDTTDPIVTISAPANNSSTSDSSVLLTFTATDDSGVAPTCDAESGSFVALNWGENTITVTCTDGSDNHGSASTIVTRADTTPPVINITAPTDNSSTTNSSTTLTFTASDNTGQAPSCNKTSGQSVSLDFGSNVISVTCTDAANNESTSSVTVTRVDNDSPVINITAPTDNSSTTSATTTLIFTATDNSGDAPSCNKTSGDTISLNFGANTISVTCTDGSSNSTTESVHVTRTDNTPPVINITAPTNGSSTTNATTTLTFTKSDDSGATPSCNKTSGDTISLNFGANVISVTCTDGSSNSTTESVTVTRTDNVAPTLSITSPTSYNSITPSASPSGSIYNSQSVLLTFTASDNSGSYSCNHSSGEILSPTIVGANTISVTCTDGSSNETTQSVTYYYAPMIAETCAISNFKKSLVAQIKYNSANHSTFATSLTQLQSIDATIDFDSCADGATFSLTASGQTITNMSVSTTNDITYKLTNFTPGTTPNFQCTQALATSISTNCVGTTIAAGGGYYPVSPASTYTWEAAMTTYTSDSTAPVVTINSLNGTTQTTASINLSITQTDNSSNWLSCTYWNGDAYDLATNATIGTGNTLIVKCTDIGYTSTTSTTATYTYRPAISKAVTGATHSCAIRVNGSLWCWGLNTSGQLGDNSTTQRLTPVPVSGMTSGVTDVVIDKGTGTTTCAIQNGAAKCWGLGTNGRLGNGASANSSVPVQVTGLTSGVTEIINFNGSSCVIQSGAVKCWGPQGNGQLGDNSTTTRTTPVQTSGLTSGATMLTMSGGTTCAVVSGAAKCWGVNTNSRLGDNTTTQRLTPITPTGLTSGVTAISITASSTCAIQSGAAKCWGLGTNGQVGDNTAVTKAVPTQVTNLTSGVTAIGTGGTTNCAIHNGAVKCWGLNTSKQIGDNTTTQRNIATQATGLTTNGTSISVAGATNCAIANGGAFCWGYTANGTVGNGTTTSQGTPLNLGATNPTVMTTNGSTSCATTTGLLYCWGLNTSGQVGNNATANALSPVLVLGSTN